MRRNGKICEIDSVSLSFSQRKDTSTDKRRFEQHTVFMKILVNHILDHILDHMPGGVGHMISRSKQRHVKYISFLDINKTIPDETKKINN